MIYEMQTCTLKSTGLAAAEERFERALPTRTALSPLGAFWRTDVGVLNQLIAVWPYRDAAQRDEVQAAEKNLASRQQPAASGQPVPSPQSPVPGPGGWPPDISEFVLDRQSKTYQAAPFSPPLTPRKLGNVYEIRIYTFPPGAIPGVIQAWSEIIEERVKHSPLVGAWYSEEGPQHEWVHIWAYADAGERGRIRAKVSELGIWPSSVVDRRLQRPPRVVTSTMRNMLVVPTRFSPLN